VDQIIITIKNIMSVDLEQTKSLEKAFWQANSNRRVHRILILMNAWESKNSKTGGEYHMLRVAANWNNGNKISFIMPKMGYRFTRTMLSDAKYSTYFSSKEDDEEVLGTARLVYLYLHRALRSLFFKSSSQEPDIIVASSHFLYDVLPATILRRRLQSKLVVYVHMILQSTRSSREGITSSLSLFNEKIGLFLCKRSADLIFAINNDIKEDLISKGFEANRIVVVGNGIEHEFIDSVKGNAKIYDACYCGRLFRRKGVYDLIEVWREIIRYSPKSRLVIIGQGPEYLNLLAIVKKGGLEKNIILTGYLSEKEKIAMIKQSKIFISPSYEESWGIAVSEAMACELPIVCYDLSAYKIYGDSILKVGLGDKKAMMEVIADLLKNENKLTSLALEAKDKATKLMNWDNIASKEMEEIDRV
jgi:glycosyltransferase involved in cell wall biosynthesis